MSEGKSLSPEGVTIGGAREDGAAFDHSPPEGGGEGGEESLLAGKFKSPEELEKAYKELQSEFTKSRQGGKSQEDGEESDDGDTGDAGDGTIESARKAVKEAEKAGIDMDALGREFLENDGLTDETYESLEGKGYDRDTVDAIIDGLKARAQTAVSTMQEVAGGQEELDSVLRWAAENLTESEANAYDRALRSGDLGTAKTMLRGIMSARADELGTVAGRDPDGKRAASAGVKPFPNSEAMVAAMQNPRYKSDPEYRMEVERRVAAMD